MACAVAFAPSAAPSAERHEASLTSAYRHLAYRETDWLFSRDGVAQRLTLYRCANGKPFAGRKSRRPERHRPDFSFLDARDGYREGVQTRGRSREVYVQQNAMAPIVYTLPPASDGVIDAGFDAFIPPIGGLFERTIAANPVSRAGSLQVFRFRIGATADGTRDGRPVRELKMALKACTASRCPPSNSL